MFEKQNYQNYGKKQELGFYLENSNDANFSFNFINLLKCNDCSNFIEKRVIFSLF